MEDVQNLAPQVSLHIDRVGVRGLEIPLKVRDRAKGSQQTVARVNLGVDLPASYKGTHMSRFVEALKDWNEEISFQSVRTLLESVKQRLGAERVFVQFAFPYFMHKKSPASGCPSLLSYACTLTGELAGESQTFVLGLEVPVMTVCPCSKAISDEGAHSQRATVRMQIRMRGFSWLEEFIELAENSASSAVYTLLKRRDEKFVTEYAFAHPVFVEDVVRNVAQGLIAHPNVAWFKVEVDSMESIHNHNAFASIEREVR